MSDNSIIARLDASRRKVEPAKDDGAFMERWIETSRKLEVAEAALSRLNSRIGQADEEVFRLREQLSSATTENAELKGKCATLEERCANLSMPAPAPERPAVDYEAKCDSLLVKLADLESKHAACGPKADAQRRVEEVLRAQVADLKSQALAVPAVVETEREYEEPTGCQIDVIRGGDDRMRSLVVRYTKS